MEWNKAFYYKNYTILHVLTAKCTPGKCEEDLECYLINQVDGAHIYTETRDCERKNEVIVVGGRPAMGKTSFALSIAYNLAVKENRTVVYYSLKMSREQLTKRMSKGVGVISIPNLYIEDSFNITADEICGKSIEIDKAGGVNLIIVDYVQLIGSGDKCECRQQEVEEAYRKLKELSMKLNAPVMILSQLSRDVDWREDHHPKLSDLRDFTAVEQCADTVILLYRDNYYDKDSDSVLNNVLG